MQKKIFSSMLVLSLLVSICNFSLIATAEGPVNGVDFQVVQTYESAAEKSNYSKGDGADNDVLSTSTGDFALSGTSSLKLITNNSGWAVDYIATNAPTPTISNIKGIFFRLKSDNLQNQNFSMTIESSTWEYLYGGSLLIYVSNDGTVIRRYPPPNFDGYVFIPLDPTINATINPTNIKKIGIFYSNWDGGPAWTGTTSFIDNVGYYTVPTGVDDSEYIAVMNAVKGQYANNTIKKIKFVDESTLEPINESAVITNSTHKINVLISDNVLDKTVSWSVVSGDVSLSPEVVQNPSTTAFQSCNVTLNSKGIAKIRACLTADPSEYTEYSFDVTNQTPINGDDYEVVQTYETPIDRANISKGDGADNDVLSGYIGETALSGDGSLKLTTNNGAWAVDYIATNAPVPTISNIKGIFFRLKSDNLQNQNFSMTIGSSTWEYSMGGGLLIYVSNDGTVIRRYPPPNFDGYVFIPLDPTINATINPADIKKIGILYSNWDSNVSWTGTSSFIDNVGYYSIADSSENNQYTALSNSIKQAYPDDSHSITYGNYNFSQSIISNINQKTTIANFTNSLSPVYNAEVVVTSLLPESGFVGTGATVKINVNGITNASYNAVVYGDINGDGDVAITDLVEVKRTLLKIITLDGIFKTAADMNGDSKIAISDLIIMKKQLLGIS